VAIEPLGVVSQPAFSGAVLWQSDDQFISIERETTSYSGRLIRRIEMNKKLFVAPLTALLLTACVVAPAHRGPGLVVAPALPVVVELGAEPYYYQSGYYYYYNNDRWSYSNARTGPWTDLPRNYYPREVRFKGGPDGRDRGGADDRGRGRSDGRGGDQNRDYRERN